MTDDALRRTTKGRVLLPGDDGFDQAAKPWNLAITQPVAAVVEATDADDVASLVRHASAEGHTVTVQPNGHGASGDTGGAILLRTKALDALEVNPDERFARVGAGVSWGDLQAAVEPHGLTGLPGSAPVVSVAGYTLGGGLSWFSRKHGFAANSVRAFDIVDASGEQRRVTADSDADLFWALRGGGGDFAIVTAVEFGLHPLPGLFGGHVQWGADKTADVFAAYREVTAQAPPELSVWLTQLRIPNVPPMIAIEAAYLGDPESGRALLSPFDKIGDTLQDTRKELMLTELAEITNDPTDPAPGKGRSELLTSLGDEVVEQLLGTPQEPLIVVQLRHVGGALADPGPDAGAHGAMPEPYLLYLFGLPLSPELAAGVGAKQAEFVEKVASHTSGRKPFTFLAPGEPASAAFDQPTIERLRAVKSDRDPGNVFRSNYPVGA